MKLSHIGLIALKELKTAKRNGLTLILCGMILALVFVAVAGGYINYKLQEQVVKKASAEKREQWLQQHDKHPHIAAHFGTFIFKPKSPLSFIDSGIDAYTGSAVYLEAHHQHEFMFRPAQHQNLMVRFGEMSVAMVMQVLLPLLIIFSGFACFTRERENNTLRMLLAQGISPVSVAMGKVLAILSVPLLLMLPSIIALTLYIPSAQGMWASGDLLLRVVMLLFVYILYFFIITCVTVLVSSYFKHSRSSLLLMLSIWILCTVILPKAAAGVGENLYPLPSNAEFKEKLQMTVSQGLDGKSTKAERIDSLKKEYLSKYNASELAEIHLNFGAIIMQSEENYGNNVHDFHYAKLIEQMEQQNNINTWSSILNPFISIRDLSMTMAGSCFYTNLHFQKQAEDYRRYLVETMNMDMAHNSKLGEFYEYKASKNLWASIDDFSYTMPSIFEVLSHYMVQFWALIIWAIILPVLIILLLKRLKLS
ncbi:MAG: DUF3526 domain-containing protein [Cytophagaceae bacterium]